MEKKLPDLGFIKFWRDQIEALVITHGHEDHIGAMPFVVPLLNRDCKIYASPFTMQLVQRRMEEYNLWDEKRFVTVDVGDKFIAGPWEIETLRVTHSIPDCLGTRLHSTLPCHRIGKFFRFI